MSSFSHRFISNPRLAWVIAIVISLCGALCLSRMPVSEYPNIIPVTITVKAMYTGAPAKVVPLAFRPLIGDNGFLHLPGVSICCNASTCDNVV